MLLQSRLNSNLKLYVPCTYVLQQQLHKGFVKFSLYFVLNFVYELVATHVVEAKNSSIISYV
jgi:hypothetical protein